MSDVTIKEAPLRSEKSYKPPIEVEWQFETSGDTRLAYACDQLIFNWHDNPSELRIDGGPVSGQHVPGAGPLPRNRSTKVKLTVQATEMTLAVDGEQKARWKGDFSKVNQHIGIRSDSGAKVKVTQVKVQKLNLPQSPTL